MKFASYLASHAATMPSKEAMVFDDRRVSFSELERLSSSVAAGLQRIGVMPGDRIALYLPNCVEFAFAFFGIVKAGAIAVPVNMRLAPPEIAFMLEDAQPCAAFVSCEHAAEFDRAAAGATGLQRIAVNGAPRAGEHDFSAMLQQQGGLRQEVPVEFDDCMISYTSGTTGKPKGAVLTQSNFIIVNGFMNGLYWGIGESDRILITTPLAHRTAFARMGNMLVHGCTLVIAPRFDVADIARIIEAERITVLGVVPTVVRLLMPEIVKAPQRFASLERILATGEAFAVDLKAELMQRLPSVKLYSFFAMTEVGVITLLKPHEQISHAATVGRVLPGIEMKLLDDQGCQVAVGEPGEVWVRTGEPGRYLNMREYYRRPEANRESIRNGWFATGDMATIDADGYVTIVDRKKDMILSGGYNIYSKEVEAALCSHEAVAQAAVVGVPDPIFGEAVAAFVVLRPGMHALPEALTTWCVERIASYKKPKFFRFLPALPENSTGKVLKRELREKFLETTA
ncbi:class I adenylate-forming enzyme family protein [Lacisediminimonas profundi]|uniref:class I adenylate-forming enzyme family protein n=1 Tax=Lacisediminimonas profundi TaxID=2603856 RepID=UPI00124B8292|nr:AMP-binding protein [Lacisediminimonas profundi]